MYYVLVHPAFSFSVVLTELRTVAYSPAYSCVQLCTVVYSCVQLRTVAYSCVLSTVAYI